MKKGIKNRNRQIWFSLTTAFLIWFESFGFTYAQKTPRFKQADIFMGLDFNYKDIQDSDSRVFDLLLNLTPGIKLNFNHDWQIATQVFIPVYNNYGDYYKRVRLNMLNLSKVFSVRDRAAFKITGGLFGAERYGLDLKSQISLARWIALEAQVGWTGYLSMATGWNASSMKRVTATGGADIYLPSWNTEIRIKGGRFMYEDYGATGEIMRHFTHTTISLYAQYSDKGGYNGGFKVIVRIPSSVRWKKKKFNLRPASNFRLTYNIKSDPLANRIYMTDPEENEREGWFNPEQFKWGANLMQTDSKTVKP